MTFCSPAPIYKKQHFAVDQAQKSVGLNIDKNLIPSKMQEMAKRQREKIIEKENQGQNNVNMIVDNPSDNFVNLSQLLRVQDDGERSEISHTS